MQTYIDELFRGVPLTEPLKTFIANSLSIMELAWGTEGQIKQRKGELGGMLQEARGVTKSWRRMIKDAEKQEISRRALRNSDLEGVDDYLLYLQKIIPEYNSELEKCESMYKDIAEKVKSQKHMLQLLMPMSFVYLVTVWDAFISDTMRKILRLHPQLISESANKVELSKSTLWHFKSSKELRDCLIESEVRRLDHDRKKLIVCFKDSWGIDWEQAKVSLNKVVEIRARRDIWVHNKGRVNQQYLDMVTGNTSLRPRQKAAITAEYLASALSILILLAKYIHKNAYDKHYSRST